MSGCLSFLHSPVICHALAVTSANICKPDAHGPLHTHPPNFSLFYSNGTSPPHCGLITLIEMLERYHSLLDWQGKPRKNKTGLEHCQKDRRSDEAMCVFVCVGDQCVLVTDEKTFFLVIYASFLTIISIWVDAPKTSSSDNVSPFKNSRFV